MSIHVFFFKFVCIFKIKLNKNIQVKEMNCLEGRSDTHIFLGNYITDLLLKSMSFNRS